MIKQLKVTDTKKSQLKAFLEYLIEEEFKKIKQYQDIHESQNAIIDWSLQKINMFEDIKIIIEKVS